MSSSLAADVLLYVGGAVALYVAFLLAAVRFSGTTPVEMPIVAVHHTQVAPDTRVLLDPDIRALLEAGFEWRGWIAAPSVHAVGAMLADVANGDCAAVMLMQGKRYVDVVRQSRGGRRVTTTNVDVVPFFLPHPNCRALRFPHVKDPAHLVRLHRAAVRSDGLRPPYDVPLPGREAESTARVLALSHLEQVQTGLFRREGDRLHRTWKAAVRGVWLLSPHTVGWHTRRLEAQARAAEAALLRLG
jgi:hypothetical protein